MAREFSCFTCVMGQICDECQSAEGIKGNFSAAEPESDLGLPFTFEEEEGVNSDDRDSDDDADGADEEGEKEEELECLIIITFCHNSGRLFYPAQTVDVDNVLSHLRHRFLKIAIDRVIVKWCLETSFSVMKRACLIPLGTTDLD